MSIFLCFLFLGLVSASPLSEQFSRTLEGEELKQLETIRAQLERSDDTLTATVNVYADKVLANIDKLMKSKYEPVSLPDISEKFKKFFVTGQFTLSDGSLSDLSTLKRNGKTEVSYSKKTHNMTIKIPLAFDNLDYEYNYKVKFMSIGPSGNVDGDVSNLKMEITLVADFNKFQLDFKKYEITNSGHISISFHGNIIYDWMLTIMGNATTIALKPIILAIIENIVAGGLKSAIATFNAAINSILG